MEWYFFGNYGGVKNEYKNREIQRVNKRTSGEKRWAQQWLEEDTITYKFSEVRRVNPKVNTVCNMIEEVRRKHRQVTIEGEERPELVELAGGEYKVTEEIKDMGRSLGKKGNKEEEEEEIIFTNTTPTVESEPTATNGRVRVTMALGSGSKRREHLRIINNCRSAQELNERTALMRTWRVEIRHEQEEDTVRGDGFCGYAAMTNIIRGVERKLDMRNRQDRLEVGITIREMISKASGSITKGWRRINELARNHKERAEGAYEELMKEATHFLSHEGLISDFWMHD